MDFFPNIDHSLRWEAGSPSLGKGPLLALPLGFEIYPLAYNKRIFNELGLEPPRTLEDLMDLAELLKGFNGPDSFAVSLRGTEDWATVHPAYMTLYRNFGAVDIAPDNGKWTSRVDSAASLEMNRYWVDLVRNGGPADWEEYNWYKAGAALGDGKAAMLFDADIVGFFQNIPGSSREAGNIAWVPTPTVSPEGDGTPKSNMWIWSITMNRKSRHKEAAWLFMEYFTGPEYQLWSALDEKNVNPPRQSVFNNGDFQKLISQADGYAVTLSAMIGNSYIEFTPHEKVQGMNLIWSRAIRKMVLDSQTPIEEVLKELKREIDALLSE